MTPELHELIEAARAFLRPLPQRKPRVDDWSDDRQFSQALTYSLAEMKRLEAAIFEAERVK